MGNLPRLQSVLSTTPTTPQQCPETGVVGRPKLTVEAGIHLPTLHGPDGGL